VRRSRLVDYDGVTAQALRDLVAWVEEGVAPPASTDYEMTSDGGITLASGAKERGGIQPVIVLTVNHGSKVEVKVGKPVRFVATAEQPGDGAIVVTEWDFLGTATSRPGR
jgi:hypothetical protein